MMKAVIGVKRMDQAGYQVVTAYLWDFNKHAFQRTLEGMLYKVYASKAEIRDTVRQLAGDLTEVKIYDERLVSIGSVDG